MSHTRCNRGVVITEWCECFHTVLRYHGPDLAAGHGGEAAVRLFLQNGATVTLKALVIAAAREGNETTFQLLLENGTTTPCQAIAIAATVGNEAICRMLLQNGADFTQSTIGQTVYGGYQHYNWLQNTEMTP